MKRRTRALEISPRVRRRVEERDGGLCVLCGRPGRPNAHYIARSQGGLGIEENILTLCPSCHERYDHTAQRRFLRGELRDYLAACYPGWEEKALVYVKGEWDV